MKPYGSIMDDSVPGTSTNDVRQPRHSCFVICLTFLTAIGGFLFGYDTGVVSGAMLLVRDEFQLDDLWHALIVSVTIGAAALFSFPAAFISDLYGRKLVILISSCLFVLGAVVMAVAPDRFVLLIGRLVVGIAIGLTSTICPLFIAEAAPTDLRGKLVSLYQVFITLGMVVSSLISALFSYVSHGWRPMFGLGAVPAIIQFVGFLFMPESPRWLIEHKKYDRAKQVLTRIRQSAEAAQLELNEIRESYENDEEEKRAIGGKFLLCAMLRLPHLRRALFLGCALQMIQQVSGINTIMYYSATIIQMAGVKDTHWDIWLAAVTSSVNFGAGLLSLYFVERIGRRKLTLVSLSGVVMSLLVIGFGFQIMAAKSAPVSILESQDLCSKFQTCNDCIRDSDCGFCFVDNMTNIDASCVQINDKNADLASSGRCNVTSDDLTFTGDWCPTNFYWLTVIGLILYLFCFSPGIGPMPWTINSEIYPQWARSTGNGLATATNWTFNLIVSLTFLSLMRAITKQGAYYLYASLSFVGLIFFYWTLPETKGKSLEQVEGLFSKSWTGSRPSKNEVPHMPLQTIGSNEEAF